jgi:hypothetical protein
MSPALHPINEVVPVDDPWPNTQRRINAPMSYLTQILQPGEKILFDGHLHWIIYRRAILLLILAGLAAAALRFTDDQNGLKFAVLRREP